MSTPTTSKTEMTSLPSGASYPTFLEPLTKNETALLRTYEKIKHYEKEASRLKAEEAKRRLEQADERYLAKVRERERAAEGDNVVNSGSEKDSEHEGLVGDERDPCGDDAAEGSERTAERRKKRIEEIQRLRQDVHAARVAESAKEAQREAAKKEEERLRRALLGEDADNKKDDVESNEIEHDDDEDDEHDYFDDAEKTSAQRFSGTGISIKKKRKLDSDNPWELSKPKPSLIANIGGGATPVNDFSKKLGMSKVSLDGSVLFPFEGDMNPWQPPDRPADFMDGCLELELTDFKTAGGGGGGNNTIAIKFHAPQDAKRFSINIAGPAHDRYNDILFHFNPRQFQKGGQLVINAKVNIAL